MKMVRLTFQIVEDDGRVSLEHRREVPVDPRKRAPGRVIPAIAEWEAEKFWEDAVERGLLRAQRDSGLG